MQKLYVYMSGSNVHQKCLSVQKDPESYGDSVIPGGNVGTSHVKTSWTDYQLYCVLHEIEVDNSAERSMKARGLLTQIDLTFIGTLAIFRKILGDTKLLSDMLQVPSLDLARAVDLIQALQDTRGIQRGILFWWALATLCGHSKAVEYYSWGCWEKFAKRELKAESQYSQKPLVLCVPVRASGVPILLLSEG